MKIAFFSLFIMTAFALVFQSYTAQRTSEPWTEEQLMKPSKLAAIIDEGKTEDIFIYSIGPSALIKNSIEIGEGKLKSNVDKLKEEVSELPKNSHIVIYCGCCPFTDCPNIRPAFSMLTQEKFTNYQLLNLSQNIKVDWIEKGYPVKD